MGDMDGVWECAVVKVAYHPSDEGGEEYEDGFVGEYLLSPRFEISIGQNDPESM